MPSYCDRSDLPTSQCAHCQGYAEPKPERPEPIGTLFRAKYDGWCQQEDCRGDVVAGDLIRYIDNAIACRRCS